MKRKPAKSLTALSCWLGAGALVLWLCSMVLVTVVTAQYLYSIAYEEYFQFLHILPNTSNCFVPFFHNHLVYLLV